MEILAEKEAEDFLKKEGFDVIDSFFIMTKKEIPSAVNKINAPFVMKISGPRILHKMKVGGVRIGLKNIEQATKEFDSLMSIENTEGIIIQPQISGDEFLLGIKSTKEFGQVIAFGIGGTNVEKIKKVAFRVCPLEKKDIIEMIDEIKKFSKKENLNAVQKNIFQLDLLSKRYPNIKELDINPLILQDGKAKVVDARIVFD
jgi:succinyl-CoA synthetase beta subunit